MNLAIVDYGSGNLRSVAKAFERAISESGTPFKISIVEHARDLEHADRIVLPGVGAFADCYANLARRPGLLETLSEMVLEKKRPFFGICVGMQLLASESHEHHLSQGLGWIPGVVDAIPQEVLSKGLKVPHMGWNTLDVVRPHPLLEGLTLGPSGQDAYFVHSYHFIPNDPHDVLLKTSYGVPLVAMLARDNIIGTQFHPEKSQTLGLALISSFLRWTP